MIKKVEAVVIIATAIPNLRTPSDDGLGRTMNVSVLHPSDPLVARLPVLLRRQRQPDRCSIHSDPVLDRGCTVAR